MVVLPEPVGPVTRISPRGRLHKSANTGGVPKSLKLINFMGICRSTMATLPLLLEDRDAEPGHVAEGKAEVGPAHLLQLLLAPLRRDALHQRHGVFRLQNLRLQPHQRPSMRSTGGWPTVMCKSLALRLTTVWSSLSIRMCSHCCLIPR